MFNVATKKINQKHSVLGREDLLWNTQEKSLKQNFGSIPGTCYAEKKVNKKISAAVPRLYLFWTLYFLCACHKASKPL